MKRHLTPLLVLAGAVTFACGGEKPAPSAAAPAPKATAAAPATTVAPAGAMMAAGETGVPECDEYIRKYEACLRDKVPAASKPQLEQALQTYRCTWKGAAAQPMPTATLT